MVAGAAALQPHVDEPAARVEVHREFEVPFVQDGVGPRDVDIVPVCARACVWTCVWNCV